MNYLKKRDEKEASKANSSQTSSHKINSASKFNKYKEWFDNHSVVKKGEDEVKTPVKQEEAKKTA